MGEASLKASRPALLGFGVENQSLGRWLAAHGIRFSVCDTDAEPGADASEWGDHVREWRLGPQAFDRLTDFDCLFRSPGIPARRPELAHAAARGVVLTSQTELFLEHCPATVVGITGTKGKGTTASLLATILASAPGVHCRLGGNIGTPPVSFLDELMPADIVLLELSSFQLQDLRRSPQAAVILPVATDHLDYHADRDEYVAAKGAICRFQESDNWVIASRECQTATALAASGAGVRISYSTAGILDGDGCWVEAGRIWWRQGAEVEALGAVEAVRLKGQHNLGNACAAATAARRLGVPASAITAGLGAFGGLPHRLEEIGERQGVLYVNDSLATTPEAAAAGLQAYAGRPVAIIAGGSSKGADFTLLGAAIARYATALVTLGAEGPVIAEAARAAGFTGAIAVGTSMGEAVAAATGALAAGGVVLLSPGCASFGMFASYAERGDVFRRTIE